MSRPTIDALADVINAFEGGMMLVSHDFRLISQVGRLTRQSDGNEMATEIFEPPKWVKEH